MMEIESGRQNGIALAHPLSDGFLGYRERNGYSSSYSSSSSSVSPPPTKTVSLIGVGSIEHRVSKMDTLAGIAIKYGVEVADIKRMNSLVTDLQMFAHKKLQIPLPGRHPPSQNLSNDSSENGWSSFASNPVHSGEICGRVRGGTCRDGSDLLQSLQSLKWKPPQPPQRRVSTTMSTLQGYYGLKSNGVPGEGTELAVYRSNRLEDGSLPSFRSGHRKSRSINGFVSENGELAEDAMFADGEDSVEADICYSERSVRRRQKADADPSCYAPNSSLKVENGGALSGKTAKSTSPRKARSRVDVDSAFGNNVPIGKLLMSSGFFSVRKSSSTPDFQESDGPSLWPTTKWTFNAHAMTRPLFDGFPKNIAPRRKTALD